MTTLLERMKALKENANTSTISIEGKNTLIPLEIFIRLYNKAGMYGYIDYMQGAKELYKFLSPIEIPSIQIPKLKVPRLFHGYEVSALTNIIVENKQADNYDYVRNLVVYYTVKHTLEEVTS